MHDCMSEQDKSAHSNRVSEMVNDNEDRFRDRACVRALAVTFKDLPLIKSDFPKDKKWWNPKNAPATTPPPPICQRRLSTPHDDNLTSVCSATFPTHISDASQSTNHVPAQLSHVWLSGSQSFLIYEYPPSHMSSPSHSNISQCILHCTAEQCTVNKDGGHFSTSSHYPEMKPKYPGYEHCHLVQLEPESGDGVEASSLPPGGWLQYCSEIPPPACWWMGHGTHKKLNSMSNTFFSKMESVW